jgi:hypothetical protein
MAEIIQMAPAVDLIGHTLALNLVTCRKFTCRGFFLSPTRPTALVDPEADQVALRTALLQGRLLDITDQQTSGLKIADTSHTAAEVEDTGKRVFLGYDPAGNMYVTVPKDEAEAEAIESEIRSTGTLKRDWTQAAEITPVTESAPEGPPLIIITDSD